MNRIRRACCAALAGLALSLNAGAQSRDFEFDSGPEHTALVELYTERKEGYLNA